MTKLLLSSIFSPLGPDHGDSKAVGAELMHGQIAMAQGIFCPRTILPHFPLDYIAHNLETPAIVLQYPTRRHFIRELKKGYDYVGFSFNLCTFHKVRQMVAWVRTYSPRSKIILGGYGTVLSDEQLAPYADHICRGEGVSFMRKLLREPEVDKPHKHPLVTLSIKVCSIPVAVTGVIFGGLGCANGCDFCATSHYFKREHIRLLKEPEDTLRLVQAYRAKYPKATFTVFDEDFLGDETWARRFLALVRASGEPPPSMFVLTSIRALSRFTAEELVEMGISLLWIGYEGKRSGYAKQKGKDPAQLFNEMRDHGIQVLASYILGFDYQDQDTVRAEVDELFRLRCTFHQFLIYGPTPGTPFHDRVEQQGRLLEKYRDDSLEYYRNCTGFYSMVKHPTMTPEQMEALQQECYERDFQVLGPALVRGLEARLLGYRRYANHDKPACRMAAQAYRDEIALSLPALLTARLLGPNRQTRCHAKAVLAEATKTLGVRLGVAHHLLSVTFLGAALWTGLCLKMKWFQQPKMIRTAYNQESPSRPLRAPEAVKSPT